MEGKRLNLMLCVAQNFSPRKEHSREGKSTPLTSARDGR